MGVILLSDTFTDSNGTALTAHTMDVGPGWTASVGTFQIQSNACVGNSNANADVTISDAGQSDVQVDVVVAATYSGAWENLPDLVLRWTGTNDMWVVQISAKAPNIQLYEKVAGVFTLRGSGSYPSTNNNPTPIKVICQGSSITVYVNGVSQIAYNSATSGQTATKFGFFVGQSGTVATACSWDDFLIRQLVQFDAASNSGYQSAVSSLSWSHNWQGNNRLLSIDVAMLSVNDTVTAMTYGGANCTLIGAKTVAGGTGRIEMWAIAQGDAGAPAVGSNTISVTISGTLACAGMAVSRTNVSQTTPTEAFNSNSGINAGPTSNAEVTVTPTTDATVVHTALATSQSSGITGTDTNRNVVNGLLGTGADQDSGTISPAASHLSQWSGEGATSSWACAGYAIRPFLAPSTSASPVYLDLENPRIQDKIQVIPR